jgi:hypothetical protein
VPITASGADVAGRSVVNCEMASPRLRYFLLLLTVVVVVAGARLHWFA